jgi:hypothetical protein
LLEAWGALVASRWLIAGIRSRAPGPRWTSRALSVAAIVGAFLGASERLARPPLADLLDWHVHGFPNPRRYPGIQRWEIEALLVLREWLPFALLLAGAAIALWQGRADDTGSP